MASERITIGLDVRNELSPALAKVRKDLATTEAAVDRVGQTFDTAAKDADGLGSSVGKAGAETVAAGKKMRGTVGDVDKLGRALDEADVSAGRYVDSAGRVREANGKFAKGFAGAADAAEESATRQRSAFSIMSSSWEEHGSKIAATSTVVAAALTFGTWKAANLAADAEQNLGAVEAVFKDHAAVMIENSQKASEAMGLTGSEYLQYSARLGAQFKGMGMPIEDAATNADALIAKGADLAAMFGTTVPESVDALSALLRGEMDPAERLGITLRAVDVEEKIKEMGLDTATSESEKLAKAQATLALINEQTADATGQYARELDTASGSMASARAEWGEAMVNFGTIFLPVLAEGSTLVREFSELLAANPAIAATVVVGLVAITSAIAGLWALTVAVQGFRTLRDVFREIATSRADRAIRRAGDAAAVAGRRARSSGSSAIPLDPTVAAALGARDASDPLTTQASRGARAGAGRGLDLLEMGLLMTPFATAVGDAGDQAGSLTDTLGEVSEGGLGEFASGLSEGEGKLGKMASAAGKAIGMFAAFGAGLQALNALFPTEGIGADVIANNVAAGAGGLDQIDSRFSGAKYANGNASAWEQTIRGTLGGINNAGDAVALSADPGAWVNLTEGIGSAIGWESALTYARKDIAALDESIAQAFDGDPAGAAAMFRRVVDQAVASGKIDEAGAMSQFPKYREAVLVGAPPGLNDDQIRALMSTGSVPGMAGGGIVPGPYTPGRDTSVWSTGLPGLPSLALSGFESILRPEVTAAVGPDWVHGMNAAARAGGVAGVRRALTPVGAATGGVVAGVPVSGSFGGGSAPAYVDQRTTVTVDARGATDPQAVGAAVVEAIIEAREDDQRRRDY